MGRIGGRTKREHTDGLDATLNVAPPPTPTPPYHHRNGDIPPLPSHTPHTFVRRGQRRQRPGVDSPHLVQGPVLNFEVLQPDGQVGAGS